MLKTIGDKCFKSDPFMLNSLKLTFQSSDNARILQGQIQGGVSALLKLAKVNFFTMILCNSENNIRNIRSFCHPLCSHSSVEV